MNQPLQEHWNQRYQSRNQPPETPTLLGDFAHLLPEQGQALDLACGQGGAALFLARRGMTVDAWDLSSVAITQLQKWADVEQIAVQGRTCDLSTTGLEPNRYDLIYVGHYLDRSLFPQLIASLKPGGLLFYQTFTAVKARPGGPSNPDYLLQRGELLQRTQGLVPVYYREEGAIGNPEQGVRNIAQLIAQKPLK